MSAGSSKARPAPAGEISVRTERRTQLLDVTDAIAKMVQDSGVQSGICYLYVPHTTAGVIINENADPDVAADMEAALARLVPKSNDYRHAEGNSVPTSRRRSSAPPPRFSSAEANSNSAAGRAFSSANSTARAPAASASKSSPTD
jgi:uncharacterized protein YqfA (UPF0365 family)